LVPNDIVDVSQKKPPEGWLQSNLDARPDTLASEQNIACYEFKYKKGVQVGALEASRDEAAGFRVVYLRT
jgi:hypothetical protein